MALTTNKNFTHKAQPYTSFYTPTGEPRVNIEGIVEIAGSSDINVDSTSISSGGNFVGKSSSATDADFTTAYAGATTITLSDYPAGVSAFDADDIEFVRQIDNTGAVTETYSRDDAAMSITTNTLTVTGAAFVATDTFVIGTNVPKATSASGGSSVGGGNNTYTNVNDADFSAAITNATTQITITGLPFTLEAKNVVAGSIKKIDTSDIVTTVPLTDVVVAGGVITLADADDFATGDEVVVMLVGPDKGYDSDLDVDKSNVENPNYGHYTDVEHIINEEDLGITGTATAGDADTLTDSGAAFDPEDVAVGYDAYSVTDGEGVAVVTVVSGTEITTAALAGTWTGDTYAVPECMRFVIPAESYPLMAIHYKLAANDDANACYMKIYGTLNDDADATDDTDWVDMSTDILGAAQIEADGITAAAAVTTESIAFINTPYVMLKYMIKIVAECEDASADNDFDVYIKRGY